MHELECTHKLNVNVRGRSPHQESRKQDTICCDPKTSNNDDNGLSVFFLPLQRVYYSPDEIHLVPAIMALNLGCQRMAREITGLPAHLLPLVLTASRSMTMFVPLHDLPVSKLWKQSQCTKSWGSSGKWNECTWGGDQYVAGVSAWFYRVFGNFVSALVTNSLADGFSNIRRG